jgi:hypothetical protein
MSTRAQDGCEVDSVCPNTYMRAASQVQNDRDMLSLSFAFFGLRARLKEEFHAYILM